MHIKKEKLDIEENLHKRINNTLKFLKLKNKVLLGNIISIENTNLAYIEPHKLTIKDTTYLFFNNCSNVYINDLNKSITLTELQDYIKFN